MYFKRDLSSTFKRYSKFPVIAIIGPRQSGKTTLVKHYFKNHAYLNLENPELRAFALEDPNRFLNEYENGHGIIIDEFQYAPQLLSYIQIIADEKKRLGYFVLTGSQNFLVNQSITQSLAGRVGILTLLPLSLHELMTNHLIDDVDQTILKGSYPRVYEENIDPIDFYPSYIHTYLERDVRQITNIGDIYTFQKLMRLCAARVGQQLNIIDLATQLGVDQRKVKQWLSVLESSYIIFLLRPHYKNYNKRLTKTPKLYFYDTGLAASLLDLRTQNTLAISSYRGNLFESFIVSDFNKQFFNNGISQPPLYFWRDQNGRIEVDCIIDRGDKLFPIEIKSSGTIAPTFFSSLNEWNKLSESDPASSTVVYGGVNNQQRSQGKILSWMKSGDFVSQLYI